MGLLPNLTRRIAALEKMDDPRCDETQLNRTLDGFARCNRLFTRYRGILRRWIISDMQRCPERRHRVVDLGAGGGDICVWLLEQCRRTGLRVEVVALDANPRVVAYARQNYGHVEGFRIYREDALQFREFASGDYVFGNHFLHHLGDDAIRALLCKLVTLPVARFVFSDIRRCHQAYWGIGLAGAVLFPGTLIGPDGRLSVRNGFTMSGMQRILLGAGLQSCVELYRLMPARLVLTGAGQQAHRTTRMEDSPSTNADGEPGRPQSSH